MTQNGGEKVTGLRTGVGGNGVPQGYNASEVPASRIKQPLQDTEDEEDENPKSSICCLQGCLAATAVGFSFFVALPTGILLVVYASNKNDVPLISVGGVLVSLPLIMLVVVIFLCFNQRRLARLGKNRVNSSKKKKTKASASTSAATTTTTSTTTTTTSPCRTSGGGQGLGGDVEGQKY